MTDDRVVDPYCAFVLDLETSVNNKDHRGFDASPFYQDNRICAACITKIHDTDEGYEEVTVAEIVNSMKFIPQDHYIWSTLPRYVVGHNVIFDFHHIRKASKTMNEDAPLGQIVKGVRNGEILLWDTMLVEYLLTGQQESMISLEDLGEKYEVPVPKLTAVTELWQSGVRTEDIDGDLLEERVRSDVEITEQIYLKQLPQVIDQGMLPFVLQQLRSLAVIAEYTYNGMHVGYERLEAIEDNAKIDKCEAQGKMESLCRVLLEEGYVLEKDHLGEVPWTHIPTAIKDMNDVSDKERKEAISNAMSKWSEDAVSSTDKLKQLIYGNEDFELEVYVPYGEYKSGAKKGETRWHKCRIGFPILSRFPVDCLPKRYLSDSAVAKLYPPTLMYKDGKLDDAAVDYLLTRGTVKANLYAKDLLENLKEYRDASKIADTFCKGIREFQFEDECIHGNLLTCRTPTGRLTSSEPNLQNIPAGSDSEIKEVFTSRFVDGKIAAVDFKQLEVVALAWKTGDPQLITDILDGRDIHFETGKEVFGWKNPLDADDDLRKKVKRINFGIIYGAGAATVGEGVDLSDEQVSDLVGALKTRYNVAFSGHYMTVLGDELSYTSVKMGECDSGRSVFRGYLTQPTGRRISVESVEPKFNRHKIDWPFTKLRNYPVQSLAYDIVSVARVMFMDKILNWDLDGKILMINEVHDEIVFDVCDEKYLDHLGFIIAEVEEEINEELQVLFNLDTPMELPLTLSFGWGNNWKEAK